jgi:hypothetical protein
MLPQKIYLQTKPKKLFTITTAVAATTVKLFTIALEKKVVDMLKLDYDSKERCSLAAANRD